MENPLVRADVLQQFDRERQLLVYLPVLYVNDKLTTISGETPYDGEDTALNVATSYVAKAFYALLDKHEDEIEYGYEHIPCTESCSTEYYKPTITVLGQTFRLSAWPITALDALSEARNAVELRNVL